MTSTSVATIVPFFNRRHTIVKALESVKAQTLQPRQLIVVDDGSTDGGAEQVDRWMSENRGMLNCRLQRQSNAGAAAARNSGLSSAEPSRFVAFLDSDDIWPADFLERTCALLAAENHAIAATCDRMLIFADGQPAAVHDCRPLSVNASLWMFEHGAGLASATLFRRSVIEKLGGFPLLITGEDTALFLPLSLEGSWLHAPGKPVVFHRGLAERLGDAKNLSEEFSDCKFSWAQVYEEFLVRGGDAHS